ncbi:GTPase IMAP family member 4 [Oryzias melastigma]|uniref:GTPase IMAP family member 4 n=1 Tax=Oryzias melastigma TaxID=30732 RepID=UPI000CF82BF4|nr:GTPase IMAP family member 4 [Oryzias melastigma]XP_024141386.1 GTPase IMAP family member 4 [Oryzias melastigma]
MECRCEKEDAGDAVADLWLNGRNLGMGVFVFVGSVALSALIQWAARFFCSTAGLYWLWGRMSMKNIRRIQSLLQWLCRMTSFLSALTCGLWWIFTFIRGFRKGSSESPKAPDSDLTSSTTKKPKLRLVLLGPSGGGRTSLVETLLGSRNGETEAPGAPLLQSTKFTVDGEELIVVDTPDLLGTSMEDGVRATEALRALQLTRPGPHAFLLVLPAPGSSTDDDQDAAQAAKAALQLFGEEASEHILPVVTHADRLGRNPTVDRLMEVEGWKSALDLCGQSPELVDNRPGLELEAQRELRRKLLERGMDMKELRGHFVHELQRREDLLREELLADMSSALAGKLGQV